MMLHLVLVLCMLAPPPKDAPRPSKEAAQEAFNDGAWQTALDLYRELAKLPGVHPPLALVGAHDSLRALHESAPAGAHLCEALDLAREVLRRDDLTDSDRAYWLELEADDTSLAGTACPAESTPTETAEPTPTDTPAVATDTHDAPNTTASAPEGPAAAPAAPDIRPRRSVARVASGSVFSAVGAGLLGGMVGALVRRDQANSAISGMTGSVLAEQRDPTAGEVEAGEAANRSYKRLGTTALVLGCVGTVSLVTGLAVLLAPARVQSLARLRPKAGGLVYFF